MDQSYLVDLLFDELGNAWRPPLDDFLVSLSPGLFLLPFPLILGAIGINTIDLIGNLAQNTSRVPILIAGRILIEKATYADSTKVTSLKNAKRYAADLVLSGIYELAGQTPPPSLGLAKRASSLKGIRKRLIKIEERQILGPILGKIYSALRAPATFVIKVLQALWNFIVICFAIGGVFCLYQVVNSDWGPVAFSQKHPRRRMRVRINRRL